MKRGVMGSLLALALGSSLHAAPLTLTVRADGKLVLPPETVRKLGLKQKRGELIAVEFPRPPEPKAVPKPGGKTGGGRGHDHDHDHAGVPVRPPKVYTGLGNDGGLTIPRMKASTATGPIPGKPGTKYRAVLKDGTLVLSRS